MVRGDIKQWNQLLAETAHDAGIIINEEFAIFQNASYMGVYGGLHVDDIHARKELKVGQKILDYMGSTELIANLFRISQTEEKLRKDQVQGADKATSVHYIMLEKKYDLLLRKLEKLCLKICQRQRKVSNKLKKSRWHD